VNNYHNYFPVLLLLICSACSQDQVQKPIAEGEWEVTTRIEIAGMSIPPVKHRQCLTGEMMIPAQQANQDCEIIQQSVSGNTVSWKMRCSTHGMATGIDGSSTYTGDTMQGSMHMNAKHMKMVSHLTGRRLGPCS